MRILLLCLILLLPTLARAEILTASWYDRASLIKEGTWANGRERRMANGERFDENALTCANRLYPMGSILRVTDIKSGKSVIVRTTDRIGKRFARTRVDLSRMAFSQLDKLEKGLIRVKVEQLR